MKHRLIALVISVAACAGPSAWGQLRIPDTNVTPERIEQAIQKAEAFLYAQQNNGNWEGPQGAMMGQVAGRTALCAYALLAARGEPIDKRLQEAINYLVATEATGTYALGLRGQVWYQLSLIKDFRKNRRDKDVQAYMAAAQRDAACALKGAGLDGDSAGMYSYQCGKPTKNYDHSCSNYGTMAVWAAAQLGMEIPRGYWANVDKGWKAHQEEDGGWNYHPSPNPQRSTASMTSGALVNLFITQEFLDNNKRADPKGNPVNPHIENGIGWLGANFKQATGGRSLYTLFNIQRVGNESGYQCFGDADWWREGAAYLIRNQRADGGWGGDISDSGFGLAFLALGRAPVVANKLQYGVNPERTADKHMHWNQRPRDVANITRWLSHELHRYLNWQIVTLNMPPDVLLQAPILYISGDEQLKFTDKEMVTLREYVFQGGLIVGHADNGSVKFSKSITELGELLFPPYRFRPLEADHPIHATEMFPPKAGKKPTDLVGLGNEAREFMILIPTADPARQWQLMPQLLQKSAGIADKEPLFHVFANIHHYATEKGNLYVKGKTHIIWGDPTIVPEKTLKIARLKYAGNWDPEPAGWEQVQRFLQRENKIKLQIDVLSLGEDALNAEHPVAYLTGTGKVQFTDEQREKLRRFTYEGGVLIVDACAGSEAFVKSMEEELKLIFKEGPKPLKDDHAVYAGPHKIAEVAFRQAAKQRMGREIKTPQIQGIEVEGKLRCFWSPWDLSVGFVGQQVDSIAGYMPESAYQLIANMIVFASKQAGQ